MNKNASEEDIQATLDFMYWCVTDETALAAMTGGEGAMPSGGAGMGFAIPFKSAPESQNLFVQLDAQMTAEGKTPVSWNFTTMPSEEWKNMVGEGPGHVRGRPDRRQLGCRCHQIRGRLGQRVRARQRLSYIAFSKKAQLSGGRRISGGPFFEGVLSAHAPSPPGQAARLARGAACPGGAYHLLRGVV